VTHSRALVAALVGLVLVAGCGGGDSPSQTVKEDVSVIDIANLPDIEETRTQMLDLIERVRAEVTRIAPATQPWEWGGSEGNAGCALDTKDGTPGASRFLRKLVSKTPLTDAQWDDSFPVVKRLAADSGLTNVSAPQNSSGRHDARFTSNDGLELVFGSREAALITANILCRRP
jgi:Lipoprotein confined to pathogenic Mycobacterium